MSLTKRAFLWYTSYMNRRFERAPQIISKPNVDTEAPTETLRDPVTSEDTTFVELIVDNEKNELLRRKIADLLYSLSKYQQELKNKIDANKRWYSLFIQEHRALEASHAELGSTQKNLVELLKTAEDGMILKKAHELESQLAQIEKRVQDKHGDQLKRVEAPVAPTEDEFLGKKFSITNKREVGRGETQEGEKAFHVQEFGVAKAHKKLEGKLGEFGQDGGLYNRETGVAVAFDGSTSMGPDAYQIGAVTAEVVESILSSIPSDSTSQNQTFIKASVSQQYEKMMQEKIGSLGENVKGAAVFVATRFFPDTGMLVSVKVGDGHILLGDGVEILKNETKEKNMVTEGVLKGKQKITISPLHIDVRFLLADEKKSVLLCSDGVDKNIKNQTVAQLMQAGGISAIETAHKQLSPQQIGDDLYAIQMELPSK